MFLGRCRPNKDNDDSSCENAGDCGVAKRHCCVIPVRGKRQISAGSGQCEDRPGRDDSKWLMLISPGRIICVYVDHIRIFKYYHYKKRCDLVPSMVIFLFTATSNQADRLELNWELGQHENILWTFCRILLKQLMHYVILQQTRYLPKLLPTGYTTFAILRRNATAK
jgi:hypothetical protein